MVNRRSLSVALATLCAAATAAALSACSGRSTSLPGAGGTACVTGMQIACACPGGSQSIQVCEMDGTYGPCDCGSSGDASGGGDGSATGPGSDGSPGDGAAPGADGSAGADGSVGPDGGPVIPPMMCNDQRACAGSCTDFPSTPILVGTAMPFTASTASTGGPCLVEPGDGALVPNNWVRPRFRWTGGTAPFKLTLTTARETGALVVYTADSQWTLDAATWQALTASAWDDGSGADEINVTVADANGSSGESFTIAPVGATGSIVTVAVSGENAGWSWLESYAVGDESMSTLLTVPTAPYDSASTDVQWTLSRDSGGNLSTTNRTANLPIPTGEAQCIGCHAITPDGLGATFVDFYPWDGVATQIVGSVGQPPGWLTPGGAETLSQGGLGMRSFSPALWGSDRHIVIASSQVPANSTSPPWSTLLSDTNASNLIWIDLGTAAPPVFVTPGTTTPATSASGVIGGAAAFYANQGTTYGFIPRSGDANSASTPVVSHDGQTIVYASNNAPRSGRIDVGVSDLYTLPFDPAALTAGTPAPLAGASSATVNEYYPDFSPDDRYVSFNTAPASQTMYYNPESEVGLVPAAGGTSTRLHANDPPACMAALSPGVTNSWLRWSVDHPTCGGKTYYWLVFASTRLNLPFTVTSSNFPLEPAGPTSQLYLTAVVDSGNGQLTTFPAVYVWPQPMAASNGYAESHYMPEWAPSRVP